MRSLASKWTAMAVALLWWVTAATSAPYCCPFCDPNGQTPLAEELKKAQMVLLGTLTNADDAKGTTDLQIDVVVKDNAFRKGAKVITIPRYVPMVGETKYKFLLFCDIFKGKLDPYRGIPTEVNSDMAKYIEGVGKLKDASIEKRLRFYFDYLDNGDLEISNDAYREFALANYTDLRDAYKNLPPDRIAKWLKEPKVQNFRFGLYASMLGHCGKDEHATLLRQMLDDKEIRRASGCDGIMAGYILLRPKEGWEYIKGMLKDPSQEFLVRYAALRAARFFWTYRPDLISHKELAEGIAPLLNQRDIADLAIDDLRKWKYWDMTDRVIGLQSDPVYKTNVVRRSILRFALCDKSNAAANRYIEEQRKKDPEQVRDAEELLKLEEPVVPAGK